MMLCRQFECWKIGSDLMKNPEIWKPSKYEMVNGQLRGSMDPCELAISSRFIANVVAGFYNRAIPAYCTGKLVDLGCGKAPLYGLYKHYSTNVILADWPQTSHPNECLDYPCDLNQALPFDDNEFDTIILSDVLEHIPEPIQLWQEMYRILSVHGKLLLNTPFYYWLHETPYDYYRYTEYALAYMAQSAGFKVIELDCFGGVPEIILDLLGKKFAMKKSGRTFFLWMIQKLGARLKDKTLEKKSRKLFPLGYFMVVEKE